MSIPTQDRAPMKVALTYNALPEKNSRYKTDAFVEFDDASTVGAIKKAIEALGHEVTLIEANENAFQKLRALKPDFVFNIAEGIGGESRESHIPAMLELLGIPYSGSGVATLAITLDKRRSKEVLGYWGIPTPKFCLLTSEEQSLDGLKFPLFVKPNAEGSSKGIMKDAFVENEKDAKKIIKRIFQEYGQSALVEEYLPGREFTVSILGNDPPRVLPLLEIDFDGLPDDLPKFDSYEVKWCWDTPDNKHDGIICPAKLDADLEGCLKDTALRTYEVLECRDFSRIDLRLDADSVPNVIDVNALPGLIPDPKENSRFPKSAYAYGMTYEELIAEILNAGFSRYSCRRVK